MSNASLIKVGFAAGGLLLGVWLFRAPAPTGLERPVDLGPNESLNRSASLREIDLGEDDTFGDKLLRMPRTNLPALLQAKRQHLQDLEGQISRLDQQIVAYQKPTEYKLTGSEVWNRGRQAVSLTQHKAGISRLRDRLQDDINTIELFLARQPEGQP